MRRQTYRVCKHINICTIRVCIWRWSTLYCTLLPLCTCYMHEHVHKTHHRCQRRDTYLSKLHGWRFTGPTCFFKAFLRGSEVGEALVSWEAGCHTVMEVGVVMAIVAVYFFSPILLRHPFVILCFYCRSPQRHLITGIPVLEGSCYIASFSTKWKFLAVYVQATLLSNKYCTCSLVEEECRRLRSFRDGLLNY